MNTVQHWIDGKPWDGLPARTAEVFDPATGEVARHVALAGTEEIAIAVEAAQLAAAEWGETSLAKRVATLFAFRELLDARKAELAQIISAEHGKVVADALGEISRGQEVVEFACGIPHLLKGAYSESVSTGTDVHSIRQPLGVVAGITPFNFPAMVPMWMYPVAIACGNAFVLKPSERDPSASNWIAQRWAEAGLPTGVFTVLHGDKVAVDGLLAHPHVKAVSFVGSTPIARYVYETARVQRQTCPGAGRCEEPHGGAPGRGRRRRGRRGGERRIRIGRGAVHGDLGGGRGRPGRGRVGRRDRGSHARRPRRRRGRPGCGDGTACQRRASRPRSGLRGRGRRGRRHAARGRARPRPSAGVLPRAVLVRSCDTGDVDLHRRDLRARPVCGTGRDL